MGQNISDFVWNYYLYMVIDLTTGDRYETDSYEEARQVKKNWSGFGRKIVIQQQHNVARIIS